MLIIAKSIGQLNFRDLMDVYSETNTLTGSERYCDCSNYEQLRNAEQDFYQYLNEVFFCQADSFYAILESEGRYVSALRMEPYLDGYLLSSLETALDMRNKGYGYLLIKALQRHLKIQGSGVIYSHVSKKNTASMRLHLKCSFEIIKDYAVYADGSVLQDSVTLQFTYNEAETT